MATDYDEPRVKAEDLPANESLEAIQTQRSTTTQTSNIDAEDTCESQTCKGAQRSGACAG